MNFKGSLKCDWPRVTLLSSGGLHYGQESFGGEHCQWMKKRHGCQRGDTFFKGSSLEVKLLGQPRLIVYKLQIYEQSNHIVNHTILRAIVIITI